MGSLSLENQLAALADIGVAVNPGVSVDDLLLSFPRARYEEKPYELVLFVLGIEIEREPWGRFISDIAWNLDVECIENVGDYVFILSQLARIANARERITHARDFVSLEAGNAWLSYELDGEPRKYTAQVNDDWADPAVLTAIMSDLASAGRDFYPVVDGQSATWFYLTKEQAMRLNRLTSGALSGVPQTSSDM